VALIPQATGRSADHGALSGSRFSNEENRLLERGFNDGLRARPINFDLVLANPCFFVLSQMRLNAFAVPPQLTDIRYETGRGKQPYFG
jgi:hypothetical protein